MMHAFLRFLSLPSFLCLAVLAGTPVSAQDTQAACTVTFDAIWSAQTHPEDFPGSNAHFSPLIGATHNDQTHFWRPGDLSTPGIQSMAETGSTSLLTNEIQPEITAGRAAAVVSGGAVGISPGTASASFDMQLSHSLLTLVTMIAPSPDWFVGVHDEPIFENGSWASDKIVDLRPYDAGTDSGPTFSSSNQPTTPAEPIALLVDPPLEGAPSMGTFRIQCASNLVFMDGFESGDLTVWNP